MCMRTSVSNSSIGHMRSLSQDLTVEVVDCPLSAVRIRKRWVGTTMLSSDTFDAANLRTQVQFELERRRATQRFHQLFTRRKLG